MTPTGRLTRALEVTAPLRGTKPPRDRTEIRIRPELTAPTMTTPRVTRLTKAATNTAPLAIRVPVTTILLLEEVGPMAQPLATMTLLVTKTDRLRLAPPAQGAMALAAVMTTQLGTHMDRRRRVMQPLETPTDPLQLPTPAPEAMGRTIAMTILPAINTDCLRLEIHMQAAGKPVSVIKSRVGQCPPRFTRSSHCCAIPRCRTTSSWQCP